MQETKYGVDPNEIMLETSMRHGFKEMRDVHETTIALVRFFNSCNSYVYFIMEMHIYLLHFVSMFVGRGFRSDWISKTS